MRFIRKNGRVIPIRDSSTKLATSDRSAEERLRRDKVIKAAGVSGAGIGAIAVGGRELMEHTARAYKESRMLRQSRFSMSGGMKLGAGIIGAGYGVLIGSSLYQGYQQYKANKIRKLDRSERRVETMKQSAATYGGLAAVGVSYVGAAKLSYKAKPVINWVSGMASYFHKRPVKNVSPWQALRLTK
jgi:hypothetical protein